MKYKIEATPEDVPVRGNAMASGNDELDKRAEDEILARLESGDEWAWCNVRVTCTDGISEGESWLGGCSYRNEEDFKAGGYYETMKAEALEDMERNREGLPVYPSVDAYAAHLFGRGEA